MQMMQPIIKTFNLQQVFKNCITQGVRIEIMCRFCFQAAENVWRRDHEVINAATSSENCSIHSKFMSVVSPAWFIERVAVPKSPLLPLLKSSNYCKQIKLN